MGFTATVLVSPMTDQGRRRSPLLLILLLATAALVGKTTAADNSGNDSSATNSNESASAETFELIISIEVDLPAAGKEDAATADKAGDQHELCGEWAEAGECESNPGEI